MRAAWLMTAVLGFMSASTGQTPPRSIQIWSTDPIPIEIAWLTIDDSGKETITARRKTAVGPPVPLEFTHGNDRYVRFFYQGASPRTYSTAELIAAKKLHVPDVLPGGELLLLVPPMTVRPKELSIEGPRVKTILVGNAVHSSLAGLPAGEYRIVRVYDGGIKGEAAVAKVGTAQTTLALLPAEDVGAIRVLAADEACATATELQLNALVRPDVGPQFKAPLNRQHIVRSKEPRCDMSFGGLKPGPFELFYFRDKASTGNAMFSVASQTVSTVDVSGPSVKVEGRATLNGKPLRDAVVMFSPVRIDREERMPPPTEVLTGVDGHYSIALEGPGGYSVLLRRPRSGASSMKQTSFVEGRNTLDFALTGGSITVEITGWEDRVPLQVRLDGHRSMRTTAYIRGQKTPVVFDALPFGEYRVSVSASRTIANAPPANARTVVISTASADATLKFDMSKR